MNESSKIAIIGGGSWATAIAKILRENKVELNWYMRNIDTSSQFKKLGHNPRYLTDVDFDIEKFPFTTISIKLLKIQI